MSLWVSAFILARAFLAPSSAPGSATATTTDLYFVRHGETVANATGKYNSRTINTFSAKGAAEVGALPRRLSGIRFDAVICSPSPRAIYTAASVLKADRLTATIWPEFNECCTQSRRLRSLPPHYESLRPVGKVKIPSSVASYFRLDPSDSQMFADGNYQDGLVQTRYAVRHFRSTFEGSGRTVLVVGHSGQGARFVEILLGKQPDGKIHIGNTSIYHLREQGHHWTLVSVSNFKG